MFTNRDFIIYIFQGYKIIFLYNTQNKYKY